jgi:hypothetical protein
MLSSPQKGTIASVMYTVVTPMLNPFIYSLRNRNMKGALRRIQSRIVISGLYYSLAMYAGTHISIKHLDL